MLAPQCYTDIDALVRMQELNETDGENKDTDKNDKSEVQDSSKNSANVNGQKQSKRYKLPKLVIGKVTKIIRSNERQPD